MRTLALVTDAYGGRGRIAQAARDTIDALASLDDLETVDVLPRSAPDASNEIPTKVQQYSSIPNKAFYALQALAIGFTKRPQLIFCNHLYMAPLAAVLRRLTGAKLIVQLHGIEIWNSPSKLQVWALESANLLFCVSRFTRSQVLLHCDIAPERAVVLNNTVHPRFQPGDRLTARAKFGISDEYVLLSVSRLDSRERYKGHDQVITSLRPIFEKHGMSLLYLIAGEGDDRCRLENIAKEAGVSNYVWFLGQVPRTDLPDLYRAADLFVLPSTGEGFGIVYLEAMACGTPALGLRQAGAIDALADGELGYSVEQAYLAEAIEERVTSHIGDFVHLPESVADRFGRQSFQRRTKSLLKQLSVTA